MQPIKLLIVDHYTLLREALKAVLNPEQDMSIIAETRDVDEAVNIVSEQSPDIILVSLLKPNLPIADIVRKIKKVDPTAKFIVFIDVKSKEPERTLFDLKVAGLLRVDVEPTEIKTAIRKVYANGSYIDPRITETLFDNNGKNGGLKLSVRQLQILKMIKEGFTNKRISAELGISHDTVKTHVRVILKKLKAADRAQAVSKAYELRILRNSNDLDPDLIGWY